MLTYEDCVGMCDLTEKEVDAIAEHEHVPGIVATELGYCLIHEKPGIPRIRRIIMEDIEIAQRRGDKEHALELEITLRHFVQTHPGAVSNAA